jgi:hypothetical protein
MVSGGYGNSRRGERVGDGGDQEECRDGGWMAGESASCRQGNSTDIRYMDGCTEC